MSPIIRLPYLTRASLSLLVKFRNKTTAGLKLHLKLSCRASSSSTASLIGDDFTVKSLYPDLQPLTGVTIPEFVWSNLSATENAPECSTTDTKYTHGDISRKSLSFAASLLQAGLNRGDCVAVILPNMPEFPICLLGIMHAGMICTTANPGYTADELEKQILISDSKMVITIPQFLPTARSAKSRCSRLKSIVVIGEAHEGCHTFSEMVKTNSAGVEFMKGSQIDTEKTVALLPFSSGTTGVPKGVELTHCNIATNILQLTQPDYAKVSMLQHGVEADRLMGVLPFFHIFGLTVLLLGGHYTGAHVLTIPRFHPVEFMESWRKFRPTILTLVPPILQFLANSPDVTKKDFESVHCIQVGAAPTGLNLINKIMEKADKYITFQEMYGLSETSPAALIMNPSKKNSKLGSCGTLVPGTLGRIADLDSGKPLGPNQRGELHLKGPQIMKGYLNNVESTRQCIDEQNWFHTGDIAYYDEDGCFYVVDRLKELIKVKGFQVAPAELEDLLRKKAEIADVAVIGIPDERSGELPRAYIVKRSDSLTEQDIHKFLKGKISKHKELKGGIEFVSVIPKSPSGKILRRELKADYISKLPFVLAT